ncbi:MAG: sigma-70 family RNA polymerase sigma factor [Planctomycetota bacterium]
MESSDTDLLERLRAGESSAQEGFVRENAPRALAVARRILKSEADASDAVQEAFVSAFDKLSQFSGDSALSTWFHRIVVNAALMSLRRRKRIQERQIDDLLPEYFDDGYRKNPRPAWSPSPAELLERDELRGRVIDRIAELPENYRNVLLMRDIQELSTREVATELGESEEAIRTRLHRARQALRRLLEEEFVE